MTSLSDRLERLDEIWQLSLRGLSDNAIATRLGVNVNTVRHELAEAEKLVQERAAKDPEIMDRWLENTLKFEAELRQIQEQAWALWEDAKDHGIPTTQLQALKLALDSVEKRARLFQLFAPKAQKGYMQRYKKIERVNSELSTIMRDVVSGCDRCRPMIWEMLQEAFNVSHESTVEEGSYETVEVANKQLIGESIDESSETRDVQQQ